MAKVCQDDGGDRSLGSLLLAWQSTGEHARFEALLAATRPVIERIALRTLRRNHVADPAAVDDAVSRTLDHLRRLPGHSTGERLVTPFVSPAGDGSQSSGDSGEAYVVWLTHERALDVVRSRRRIGRHVVCFSELSIATTRAMASRDEHAGVADDAAMTPSATGENLHGAIRLLDGTQRVVIELLLAGESQAVIARQLGICAGTVSRLRSKAIVAIRRLLAE